MGLIKAGIGSVGGVLADQWKEYIYCDALGSNVLAAKGIKKGSRRSSNRKGFENVITNGSVVAVAEGQCMLIVEQGKVVDLCAQPGEYIYDASTEPSVFDGGNLAENIKAVFSNVCKRFTFGGEAPKDQRVYYFNTKELIGNKYGTPSPVPFRVVDTNIGLDMDISVRCFGEYSYRLTNPMLFYTNICGNVDGVYTRDQLDGQLKTELLTALQPAFAKISALGIRYSALPGHTMELANALNEVLSSKWRDLRGIEIISFGVSSIQADEEDEKMLKDLQRNAVFRNPDLAAAHLVGAQAAAMQTAAANEGAGSAMAFMGMHLANQAGGASAADLYQLGWRERPAVHGDTWTCSCGTVTDGKFCPECGQQRPVKIGWACSCGTVNQGKFCTECGAKRPASALKYVCDKCGWKPEDPTKPPKFCPECGDRFDESDLTE